MARVNTNDTGLSFGVESSLGTAPTSGWKGLEPNAINTYGATITTVSRRPISSNRQEEKGTVTDLEATVEIDQDLTIDAFDDFIEAFVYAEAHNADMEYEQVAAVASTGYTIPSSSANEAAKYQFTSGGPISLVYVSGYADSSDNGLLPLTADLGSSATTLPISTVTSSETPGASSAARVELAGIRPEEGDLAITVSGETASLTSGNNSATNNIDFTTLGLTIGQFIHVGGLTSGNQFSAGYGYGRITAIAAGTLTLDKLAGTLATDAGASETVDLLFGKFIRNVATTADSDDERFLTRTFHFELSYPNLGGVGTTEYEYASGNTPNQLTLNIPLTDKATFTTTFVGQDANPPTSSRNTGPSDAITPNRTVAFNTSSDVVRLRTSGVGTAADTCFKSLSFTINNNVTPEKCIGTLGNAFINTGILQVGMEAQMLFTDNATISAIRNNTTVTLDMIIANPVSTTTSSAIAIDIPSMTFAGGGREFPQDQSVLVNLTGTAFRDTDNGFGTSIGVSLFPIVPTAA